MQYLHRLLPTFPYPVYIAAIEMLAKACANTALQVSIQGMICEGIRLFGDDRQKNEFLKEKGLVEGRSLASFALTEPCCGSAAKSFKNWDSEAINYQKYALRTARWRKKIFLAKMEGGLIMQNRSSMLEGRQLQR